MATAALPLFHLYGDPPDDQAFDFIHIETIASRSSIHDWTIRAHRHRNLFQILVIERGGGEMTFEAATIAFAAPCAILVPATIAHGFRFQPAVTDGWVTSFTEDVAEAMGDRRGEALARLKALSGDPVVPLGEAECERLSALARQLHEEGFLARAGYRIAMRGLLALMAVEVARLAAGRARAAALASEASGSSARAELMLEPTGATVEALRKLVEEHFQKERQLAFYADKLAMTVDRLNDHVKRATGVTAGHLIRQRVLTEAKRQLVFTTLPIHEIAYDLAFSDPSHFARFFRKQTGSTPHEFRAARGG
jgi:AraC family transcriptional regulator, transcriptional activator of pobA